MVGCQALAARLKRIMEEHTYRVGRTKQRVKIVTCVATYPDEASNAEELIRVAQERLQTAGQQKVRILVVDDEAKLRAFLKDALEFRGFEVLTAATGPDALKTLEAKPVDLILLDIIMPVMDGYEVYHLLKENQHTKHIPVIVISAKGERTDRLLGIESDTYNYIMKPFQLEELMAKVQGLLQQTAHG